MARLSRLYDNTAALHFRSLIRPSLVGQIGAVEPDMAIEAAAAFEQWLHEVIDSTMRATTLHDRNGLIGRQLRAGARIIGRSSFLSLRGSIWAYPWLFAHEYGAHITPKRTKYLALPIYFGLRADGSPKFRNASSWNRYGSFVYNSKRTGGKYLAYRSAEGTLRILYVLIDSTDIPARLGLNKMADSQLGRLLSMWGQIYVRHASNSGVINLWGARP